MMSLVGENDWHLRATFWPDQPLLHRFFLLPYLLHTLPHIVFGILQRDKFERPHYKPAINMFRRPRETAPFAAASELGRVFEPLPVLPCGPLALGFLGVPIAMGVRSKCFDFFLTIPVLDKYGGSSTPADRLLRPIDSLHCHSRPGLTESNPEITRLGVCLYCTGPQSIL